MAPRLALSIACSRHEDGGAFTVSLMRVNIDPKGYPVAEFHSQYAHTAIYEASNWIEKDYSASICRHLDIGEDTICRDCGVKAAVRLDIK